jgi:hypothetical protein
VSLGEEITAGGGSAAAAAAEAATLRGGWPAASWPAASWPAARGRVCSRGASESSYMYM